jgi:ankyrin repeat protein
MDGKSYMWALGASFTRATIALTALGLLMLGCGSSLHDTIAAGDLARAEAMLIKKPALVESRNKDGKTPLHYAVNYKRLQGMELLLKYGADINSADRTGATPLHTAAMSGQKEAALWLLEHGAAIESKDSFGDTPLQTAAIFGQGAMLKLLFEHGAKLDTRNALGKTALDLAKENRQDKVAQYIEHLLADASSASS